MLEKIKNWNRDPPIWIFIALCILSITIIYFLRNYLPKGNESIWGWCMVGIGCAFMVDVILRQTHIENRWSTYIRELVGFIFFLLGIGFICGFREFLDTYIYIIIFISIFTLFIRKRLKKDI